MKNLNFSSAAFAGFVGTAFFTVFNRFAPAIGLPEGNIPGMLAGFMGAPILAGWIMHFAIGIVLAVIYGVVADRLPFSGWVQGSFYGIFPWLLAMTVVMPMMGMPVFTGSAIMAGTSLIGHFIYGGFVGCVYSCCSERS